MNRSMKSLALGVALTIGLGIAIVSAQAPNPASKEPNQAESKGKDTTGGTISRLAEATDLIAYARENQSAVAMLSAVQMLRGVRLQDGKARLGTVEEKAPATAVPAGRKGQTAAPTLDVAQLLNEAKGWAKDNANLTALLDAELAKPAPTSTGTLGAAVGAIRQPGRLLAGYEHTYKIVFRAGEVARIVAFGDGDTDLDLFVYDEFGNLIARDADYTDRCIVEFTPKWNGTFRIVIRNLGRVYNDYILATN